jgi:hypothetical protein
MKLKKAMRLYPIESYIEFVFIFYELGGKKIWKVFDMWCRGKVGKQDLSETEPKLSFESDAVNWLIEGATKLSPIQIAMKEHPEIKLVNGTYYFGKRGIFKSEALNPGKWMQGGLSIENDVYTEQEAVDWLLKDVTSKAKEPVIINFNVPWGKCMVTPKQREFELTIQPDEAQAICDQLYRAGYRPNKDKPIN